MTIDVTTHDAGILQIHLNRPQQLNALNREVLERLAQLLHEAKLDAAVKAILLTGAGKGFCAGADISQLAALPPTEAVAYASFGQSVFRSLELLGKPSLAAIHGFAFGGGCELAMAATLRIAAYHTVFGQPEVKLGLMPGFGGTQRLARLVGSGRALMMCVTGKQITAELANQWGLVNELVMPEDLLSSGLALLKECVQLSPIAIKNIMSVIDEGYGLPLEAATALEASYFGLCCQTKDKQEGVEAFLKKRTPHFTGE